MSRKQVLAEFILLLVGVLIGSSAVLLASQVPQTLSADESVDPVATPLATSEHGVQHRIISSL